MRYQIVKKSRPEARLWLLPDGAKAWATDVEIRAILRDSAAGALGWRIEGDQASAAGGIIGTTLEPKECRATFEADEAVHLAQGETDAELVRVSGSPDWMKWAIVFGAGVLVAFLVALAWQ